MLSPSWAFDHYSGMWNLFPTCPATCFASRSCCHPGGTNNHEPKRVCRPTGLACVLAHVQPVAPGGCRRCAASQCKKQLGRLQSQPYHWLCCHPSGTIRILHVLVIVFICLYLFLCKCGIVWICSEVKWWVGIRLSAKIGLILCEESQYLWLKMEKNTIK